MDKDSLERALTAILGPEGLDEIERDTLAEKLGRFPLQVQREILRQIPVIWPVSYALFFAFVEQVERGLGCLRPEQLSGWVHAILDVYEAEGLRRAQIFMEDVEANYLCPLKGESGFELAAAVGRLRPYLRGLAGREIDLAPAPETYTDTATIFLPATLAALRGQEENFLLYKLIVTFQWALAERSTLCPPESAVRPVAETLAGRYGGAVRSREIVLDDFFSLFPEPVLAHDLYLLCESVRIFGFLEAELPGLMRDFAGLAPQLVRLRADRRAKAGVLEQAWRWALDGLGKRGAAGPRLPPGWSTRLSALREPGATVAAGLEATAALYGTLEKLEGAYRPIEPTVLAGRLRPAAALEAMKKRRAEMKERFVKALAAVLPELLSAGNPPESGERAAGGRHLGADDEGAVMPAAPGAGPQAEPEAAAAREDGTYITLDDRDLLLPESLRPLAREIARDLGRIPGNYISSAAARAGGADSSGPGMAAVEEEEAAVAGTLVYDEWDYRRAGFRKNWCVLHTKEIVPVGGTFIDHTLRTHRGLVQQLRRQFEMMRTQERHVKRQRDGDDIDLDALTDSLADMQAGLAPSERLFVRLLRKERSIAAVFLVDMSSSTEGWVSTALKEALVLMCEALEVLGDRYAIFGFSGMRRLRAELFRVKDFEECYDETVKGRIAAISPQDYTRMGPPIRHAVALLGRIEAKVRLLVTLSDGKPEDYDDYKGAYAVEDTRHALIEAKALGIHPFCITIDRQAHDYIPHMYGEVSYIFIDDVRKLPRRMPEVYRNLTS